MDEIFKNNSKFRNGVAQEGTLTCINPPMWRWGMMPRENGQVSNLHKIEKGGGPSHHAEEVPEMEGGGPQPCG